VSYYCITLKLADDEPNEGLTVPQTEEITTHWTVPESIVRLFEGDNVELSTALLTFEDGSQVLWGTK
jgi:hypothetical protein